MQVEVGKRYLLVGGDGLPNMEGVVNMDKLGSLTFRPDGTAHNFMMDPSGRCFGIGQLRELEPAPTQLPPIFGHDATEFERLRRVFRDWDFQQCT